ncbi:ATP-binding protein [Lentzea sp. HUAS12]|uniref:sensor histidine kinase n=1 Tax=Lentzea sp. HUAS12 TaxID=2951806 RepID=UPI00209FA8D9|nr:ATP-binding protein [Lentzea sp. HUAS12]USX49914.1 ATP-binding protein [Lentzea sp. HUAS12]
MRRHLRFAPEVLSRLGEELIPHPDLGVIELVRNAYDADAKYCSVQLNEASEKGGVLIVEDDGDGMTAEDIYDSFLLIGKSKKTSSPLTQEGRYKVGEKGLGRLAALRLGEKVELFTRPRSQPGTAYRLSIDWAQYDSVLAVEDVQLTVVSESTDKKHGTTVKVENLRQKFTTTDVERLARSLLLLTGPFQDSANFRADLNAPEFRRMAEAVNLGFLDEYDYKIEAVLDNEGQASARLFNWRGEEIAAGDHSKVAVSRRGRGRKRSDVPIRFEAPAATFDLWWTLLSGNAFKARESRRSVDQVRQWLTHVGGVHFYHRGLRVHPYGDPGNDWLEMNLRRSASPERRPSTNNSVGRLKTNDDGQALLPKTDRTGFVENLAFLQLQEFSSCVLDWATSKILEFREEERTQAPPKTRERMHEAEKRLNQVVKALPPQYRPIVEQELKTFQDEASEHVAAIESNLLLYRTLSTLGTSTAVFAHESLGPAGRLSRILDVLRRRTQAHVDEATFRTQFADLLDRVQRAADSVQTFARLPLRILQRQKRSVSDVDVNAVCREIVDLFKTFLDERQIAVQLNLLPGAITVRTTVSDIEAILANLVTNSAHALLREDAPSRQRVIRIETQMVDRRLKLSVDDSGPGIVDIPLNEIWLPGRTSRTDGTGLGLTIVRDIVADLRGNYSAAANGDIGGAHFEIVINARHQNGSGTA